MEERLTLKQVAFYALKWGLGMLAAMVAAVAVVCWLWLASDMGCQM